MERNNNEKNNQPMNQQERDNRTKVNQEADIQARDSGTIGGQQVKKGMFTGWTDVFRFTFVQAFKVKNFLAVTIGVAVLLLVGLFAVNTIVAYVGKDEKKPEIEKVYYSATDEFMESLTQGGLDAETANAMVGETFFNALKEETGREYEQVKADDFKAEKKLNTEKVNAVYVHASVTEEDQWMLEFVYGKESKLGSSECEKFRDMCEVYIENLKLTLVVPNETQALLIGSPCVYEMIEAGGDERSEGETMLRMFLPIIVCFVLYLVVLVYGQSIMKSVIAEKTSKLLENLLVTVQPYGLILGKVLAMVCVAICQLMLWLVCGVGGFLIGDKVAHDISSNYNNVVLDIIKVVQKNTEGAFSTQAVVLAIVSFIVGFAFFCTIAALVASRLQKIEDLSSAVTLFQMPVIIGFFAAYLIPAMENANMAKVIRYIPFTSAYCLSSDILIGSAGMAEAIICLLILIVSVLVLTVVTGIIYKRNIFSR